MFYTTTCPSCEDTLALHGPAQLRACCSVAGRGAVPEQRWERGQAGQGRRLLRHRL